MAPWNGAAEPEFWTNTQRVQMLLTVALAMLVKNGSTIDFNTLADMVGEGRLSQASTRGKLVQLIEQGKLRIRDHRERSRAAKDSSFSGSPMSRCSLVKDPQDSRIRPHPNSQNMSRKRPQSAEAEDESRDSEVGSATSGLHKEMTSRPRKKSKGSRRARLSRDPSPPARQPRRDDHGQANRHGDQASESITSPDTASSSGAGAGGESSKKRSGNTRIRKLRVGDSHLCHKTDGPLRSNDCSCDDGSHDGDPNHSSTLGGTKETAIFLSDEEVESEPITTAHEWNGFESSKNLYDSPAPLGSPDLGEQQDAYALDLELAALAKQVSLRPDLENPDDSTKEAEQQDDRDDTTVPPHRETTPDWVKLKGRRATKRLSMKDQNNLNPGANRSQAAGSGKTEQLSRGNRNSSRRQRQGVTVNAQRQKIYAQRMETKTRHWQAPIIREVSVARSLGE